MASRRRKATGNRLVCPDGKRVSFSSEGAADTTIRVMVVEDHDGLRRLLSELIDQQPDLETVAQAGSLGEARYQAFSRRCDVAVLDTGLPDGQGANLIGEVRELWPGCAVLMLCASMDHESLAKASEAGAEETMDKLAPVEQIVEAIRHVGNP